MRKGGKGRGEEGRRDLEDDRRGVWSQALEVIQGFGVGGGVLFGHTTKLMGS